MIKLEMFLDVFTLSFMFYGMLNNVYDQQASRLSFIWSIKLKICLAQLVTKRK